MNKFFVYIVVFLSIMSGALADGYLNMVQGQVTISGIEGTTATSSLSVENTDSSLILNDVTISENHEFTVLFSPNSFDINPSSTESSGISVSIPSGKKVGQYTGVMSAQELNNNSNRDTSDLIVNVLSNNGLLSSTDSQNKEGTAGTTVAGVFHVTNARNDDVLATLGGRLTLGSSSVSITSRSESFNSMGEKDVSYSIVIPRSLPAGTYSGHLNLTYDGGARVLSVPITLIVNQVKVLEITDVEVDSPGDDEEIAPGETFFVTVDFQNNDDLIDLEDVTLTVKFVRGSKDLEDDSGDRIEEESSGVDLDAGDDDSEKFEFTMPNDVDDGDDWDVFVEIEGDDADSSARYSDEDSSVTISTTKESHDLLIFRYNLNPMEVSCERQISIEVGIRNIGDKDEDSVKLQLVNNNLGINLVQSTSMDADYDDDSNEYVKTFDFEIGSSVKKGTYPIEFKVEYDNAKEMESAILNLKVSDCGSNVVPIVTTCTDGIKNQGETGTDCGGQCKACPKVDIDVIPSLPDQDFNINPPSDNSKGAVDSFMNSGVYLTILVLMFVFLFGITIAMIIKLFSK